MEIVAEEEGEEAHPMASRAHRKDGSFGQDRKTKKRKTEGPGGVAEFVEGGGEKGTRLPPDQVVKAATQHSALREGDAASAVSVNRGAGRRRRRPAFQKEPAEAESTGTTAEQLQSGVPGERGAESKEVAPDLQLAQGATCAAEKPARTENVVAGSGKSSGIGRRERPTMEKESPGNRESSCSRTHDKAPEEETGGKKLRKRCRRRLAPGTEEAVG